MRAMKEISRRGFIKLAIAIGVSVSIPSGIYKLASKGNTYEILRQEIILRQDDFYRVWRAIVRRPGEDYQAYVAFEYDEQKYDFSGITEFTDFPDVIKKDMRQALDLHYNTRRPNEISVL